jgi:hypothetical protein
LNDGLEGWMTAAAKSPSEPDTDSRPGTRKLNKFKYSQQRRLSPTTRDPLRYDFMTKHYGFMTKLISGISGQSENGLLTRNQRI